MDSRLLEYFLITAREESISKAAEIIHISQPSLSRQIAEMENELHVRLFQSAPHYSLPDYLLS